MPLRDIAGHIATSLRLIEWSSNCEDIQGHPNSPPNGLREIYSRSTSVSVEPCGSRNLACGSYGKLLHSRSSSAFPAIRRFVVDNETATATTMTTTTGADSAAINYTMISNGARAVTGALADFNIRKLSGRFAFGWLSLFSLFL